MSPKQTEPLSLKEIASILVKHHEIHEGLWGVAFGINIAVGQFGPNPEQVFPGAMFGISNVFLLASEKPGTHVVDAATVNPAKKLPVKKVVPKKAVPKK